MKEKTKIEEVKVNKEPKTMDVTCIKRHLNDEYKRAIEEGEVIASFDDIQIGGLDELRRIVTARGGYGNPGWVTWDTTKELNLNFSQGTFSKKQLQILLN